MGRIVSRTKIRRRKHQWGGVLLSYMYRALAADPATRTDKMVGLRTVANRRVIAPRPAGKRRRRHDDGPAAKQVVRSKSRERATVYSCHQQGRRTWVSYRQYSATNRRPAAGTGRSLPHHQNLLVSAVDEHVPPRRICSTLHGGDQRLGAEEALQYRHCTSDCATKDTTMRATAAVE